MKNSKLVTKYQQQFQTVPHAYWIIGGVLLSSLIIYSLVFFVPKTVAFSYGGETCASQLVLLPGVQKPSSDEFNLTIKNELKIGSFAYAATKVCAEPKGQPIAGEYRATLQPGGGVIMAKQFTIKVADPPVARSSDLIGKTISTALPLKVGLSEPDTIHTYELMVNDKTTNCQAEDAQIACDVASLALTPGADYTAALLRSYKEGAPTELIEGAVETLIPITLKKASVKNNQTLYTSPKKWTFEFDKPVDQADVIFSKKEAKSLIPIEVTTNTEANKLSVSIASDLDRKAEYTLTLKQVVADNGSALEKPHVVNFKTSGGPKPKSVSVGSSGVSRSARIVVKLDQPIKEDVDIAKFARVTGVKGQVEKQSDTELVFSIQAGLCQAFSLVIDKGVASGSNSAVSEAWKFDARTVCGTTGVIGYSVQGRPIIAYYFGNGSKTVLFTGGIHGEEQSAQQTMQAWADYLMTYAYKIPADKQVVVVPNLNPDGIAIGKRYNANNVNLGRNYPTANWSASIDTPSGELPKGGGKSPGSEPETKAMMALTSQLRPRLEVSFHAQGSLVGANKVGDSVAIGNTYANTVGYATMFYNAEEVMGYSITGEYEEWMGERFGTPAILIELPTRNGNYLYSQLNALMKMLAV